MRSTQGRTGTPRPRSADEAERAQGSPAWSLAPYGWQQNEQQQRPTSPTAQQQARPPQLRQARQRTSPPGRGGVGVSNQQKGPVMPQLHKYAAVCGEIQPADGSPPALALRPLSAGSPGGDRLRVLCSRGARACRTHAWSALLAAVVLAALAWGGSRLAAARQRELAQWLEYVPARQAEPAHGAAEAAVQAAAAQRPLPQCTLQLDGSPWERHCQRLRRVCVDQGQLILYEDRYQQLDGRRAGGLPELKVDTSKLYEYPWRKPSSSSSSSEGGDGGGSQAGAAARRDLRYLVQDPTRTRRLEPPHMRPATSQEPTPYLQDPQFSSCTVPVFVYPSWRANFFHIFKDAASVYYALLRRTPWRRHAKLVVVTPDGLPLTQPEAQLLPSLSGLSVQTLADFSRRLLPGYQPGQELDPEQQPASHEGGEQRCFADAFFCGRNFPQARWPLPEEEAAMPPQQVTERLRKEVPFEPYSFGQAAVAYHTQAALAAQQMQRRQWPMAAGGGVQDGISLQEEAAAAGAPQERAATTGRLRILLVKRGGEGRQVLNAADLLAACNSWQYRPPNSTAVITAQCSEVEVPDLASGIAAAREADVIMGVHGANLANGWMMRPGASVIELTPYQFERGRGSFVFSVTNSWDATSQVLWWVGVVCDPAISTPGPTERARRPPEDWWPRDRNARVPWGFLDAALRAVVAAGGSQQRYLDQYWSRGLHKWHIMPGGALHWGGAWCPNANYTAG